MSHALSTILAKRSWFVPDIMVHGLPALANLDLLAVESVEGIDSVFYGTVAIGDSSQKITFADLNDHRGNPLPTTIQSPRVIVRPRSIYTAYPVGTESETSFNIVRSTEAPEPIMVDLLITEMGD